VSKELFAAIRLAAMIKSAISVVENSWQIP